MKMKSVLVLALLFISFSSFAKEGGSHVGGGGDVRRYHSLSALQGLSKKWDFYQNIQCEEVANETEKKFRFSYSGGYWASILSDVSYRWTEASQGRCLNVLAENGRWIFQFSYADCSQQTDWFYYPDLLLSEIYRNDLGFQKIPYALFMKDAKNLRDEIARPECSLSAHYGESNPDPMVADWSDAASVKALIEKGRDEALDIVKNLRPARLTARLSDRLPEEVKWFIANQSALIAELQNTPIVYDGKNVACGFTEMDPASPVVISLASCKGFNHMRDAQWFILHEVLHHLGIEDEMTADRLAYVILEEFYPANFSW